MKVTTAIQNFKGFAFTSMTMHKEIKALKKSRKTKEPFTGVIEKRQYFTNIGIGADYQKVVNDRLKAEGKENTFQAESLPFGEWKDGSKTVITHNGEDYIRFYKHENTKCQVQWFLNGIEVTKNEIEEFLPSSEINKTPIDGSQRQKDTGIEKTVKPFSPSANNIIELKLNGVTYR